MFHPEGKSGQTFKLTFPHVSRMLRLSAAWPMPWMRLRSKNTGWKRSGVGLECSLDGTWCDIVCLTTHRARRKTTGTGTLRRMKISFSLVTSLLQLLALPLPPRTHTHTHTPGKSITGAALNDTVSVRDTDRRHTLTVFHLLYSESVTSSWAMGSHPQQSLTSPSCQSFWQLGAPFLFFPTQRSGRWLLCWVNALSLNCPALLEQP